MANSLASAGARAPHSPSVSCIPRPLSWVKRRARRLALVYRISRRDAVANAAIDWSHFNPTSAK
jgi:hypothetical protein